MSYIFNMRLQKYIFRVEFKYKADKLARKGKINYGKTL